MENNKLPEFVTILHKNKAVLVDPQNGVCMKVSKRIAENLNRPEVREKLYPVWREQSRLQEIIETQREKINTVYLMVTRRCNMDCAFCAIDANQGVNLRQEFKISDINDKIIPFLNAFCPHKLIVTGGEPLVKDKILEIIKALHKGTNCPITLQSNGLLLDGEITEGLKGNIAEIDFSTKHMFETPERQQELREHIRLCQRAGIDVVLSFIYEKVNRRDLFHVIDIAAEYNTGLIVNEVSPVGRAKENSYIFSESDRIDMNLDITTYIYDKGYEDKKLFTMGQQPVQVRSSCGAYGKVLAVFPEGNIYMCQCLEDDPYKLGNVLEDSPRRVYEKLSCMLKQKEIREKFCVQEKLECSGCEYRYLCGGNCPIASGKKDSSCYFTKKMIDFQLFYQGLCHNKRELLMKYIQYLATVKDGYSIENV